jgi:hypothetical protein
MSLTFSDTFGGYARALGRRRLSNSGRGDSVVGDVDLLDRLGRIRDSGCGGLVRHGTDCADVARSGVDASGRRRIAKYLADVSSAMSIGCG